MEKTKQKQKSKSKRKSKPASQVTEKGYEIPVPTRDRFLTDLKKATGRARD